MSLRLLGITVHLSISTFLSEHNGSQYYNDHFHSRHYVHCLYQIMVKRNRNPALWRKTPPIIRPENRAYFWNAT